MTTTMLMTLIDTYRENSRIYFLGVKMEVIPNMQYKVNHYNW